MLQTALGFRLTSETTALAGRITGVKPSLPTSETISPWTQIQTHWVQPISQAATVHKDNLYEIAYSACDVNYPGKNKKAWKTTFHFSCDLRYLVNEFYYHYMSSCTWFNNSSSQAADSDLRYYSWFPVSQLGSEIHLSLYMTRTDTDRRSLAGIYKDEAQKNRIQEETRLTALIHKILAVIQIQRVNTNITVNTKIIVHRNY